MKYYEVILLFALAILYRPFIKPFLRKIASKTKTNLDDLIIDAVANPSWTLVWLIVIEIILRDFYPNATLIGVLKSLEIIVGSWLAYRFIHVFIEFFKSTKKRYLDEGLANTALSILDNISKILIGFIATMILLSYWNIDITPILASAGIAGIAIGFALKDILENVFAGILIFLDPPFRVGDIIQLDGLLGEIIEIGLRNTKIKTFDNNIISVPNSEILKAKLMNFNMPNDIVRVSLKIGVSYDTDPDLVKETVLEILKNNDKVLKDPEPQVLFMEFGDFALIFEVRFWVKLENKLSTIDEVNTTIWKVFKEKGIEIPFPIQTIYLRKS